jgi:hypothetical protein
MSNFDQVKSLLTDNNSITNCHILLNAVNSVVSIYTAREKGGKGCVCVCVCEQPGQSTAFPSGLWTIFPGIYRALWSGHIQAVYKRALTKVNKTSSARAVRT